MRRKAFILMFIMILLLAVLDYGNVPLLNNSIDELEGRECTVTALIKAVNTKSDKVTFELKVTAIDGDEIHYRDRLLATLYVSKSGNFYEYGSSLSEECDEAVKQQEQMIIDNMTKYSDYVNRVINFKAVLEKAKRADNPGTFDYYRYLKGKGIGLICTLNAYDIYDDAEEGFIKKTVRNYERWLTKEKNQYLCTINESSRGFVSGVVFGDKSLLDEDIYEMFRENGTAHVLAVSGLHIGLVYSLFVKLAGKRKSKAKIILLVFLMLSYGSLTLWTPSVMRAEIMIALRITAEELDLRYDLLNSAGVAAIILMFFNPYIVFSTSFQMSFLAIISIGFITPALKDRINEMILVSFAVFIGLMPYQAYVFNSISLTSVFANVPVIALVSVFTPVAVISFIAFIITGNTGLFNLVLNAFSALIVKVNSLTSLNGTGSLEVASPGIFIVVFVTLMIFFLSSDYFLIVRERKNNKHIFRSILLIVCISATFSFMYSSPIRNDDIVFVNVGQGDCIHINDKSGDLLIDGGGRFNYNVGEKIIKSYLLKNGCSSVNIAMATHLHMDHYKGLEELSECFKLGKVLTGMTAGTELKISDKVFIRVLWPESIDPVNGQDENSECSVFMVYYNGYRILITGDLDVEGEKKLLQKYQNGELKADILKVGHHGSATSTSDEFIREVSPVYAVIQVGKNNYGHPSPETVARLKDSGAEIYTTLDNGAIGFSFTRHGIKCHSMY